VAVPLCSSTQRDSYDTAQGLWVRWERDLKFLAATWPSTPHKGSVQP
jgi:hypothetical protein